MVVTNKLLLMFALCIGFSAHAQEPTKQNDEICLQHLGGGGTSDYVCYNYNRNDALADSNATADVLRASMPKSDPNIALLDNYMRLIDDQEKLCDLPVNAAHQWKKNANPETHITMFDVIKSECRYTLRKQQNDYLHDVLAYFKAE